MQTLKIHYSLTRKQYSKSIEPREKYLTENHSSIRRLKINPSAYLIRCGFTTQEARIIDFLPTKEK